MKIMIDIPEENYNFIKKQIAAGITNPLKTCIANGTPLPKGHGRLYDEKAIRKEIKNPYQCETILDGLKLVKPIIEAESEDK